MSTIIGQKNQENKDMNEFQTLARNAFLKKISDEVYLSINYLVISSILCSISLINKGELLKIFKEQLEHGIDQIKKNPQLLGIAKEAIDAVDINATIDNTAAGYFTIIKSLEDSINNESK